MHRPIEITVTPSYTDEWASHAISFVASIIAPGFEPVTKIPMYLALRRWNIARRETAIGSRWSLMLALSATLALLVLRLMGVAAVEEFFGNPEVESLANPTLRDVFLSAGSTLAGMVMLISYRGCLIPGAFLITLMTIEATLVKMAWQLGARR